jgi:putative hydrolase
VADSGPRIKADLHVHTIASGHGFSTVREICAEAALRGIEMIGVTDHGPAMPGGPHVYNFTNLVVMPRVLSGVMVLRSAECNIIDTDGGLDLHERVLGVLDIVHAGLHPLTGYPGTSVEDNTAALLGAIKSGKVDVLVHPGNPLFPFDHRTVVEAAASNNVLLEINNSSFTVVRKGSIDNCRLIIREAMRAGARICVGTDAHDASLVGVFEAALELVDEVGFPAERIINRDKDSVLRFLSDRGRKDILFS